MSLLIAAFAAGEDESATACQALVDFFSAKPFAVSWEYRKELLGLLGQAGCADGGALGLGAEPVNLGGAGAARALRLSRCGPPLSAAKAAGLVGVVKLGARDWLELRNAQDYLDDNEHKIVKADSGGKVTGGNEFCSW